MTDKKPNSVLVSSLTFLNRASIVLFLALLAYVAWRILGGDPALPFARRVERELITIIALVPPLFVAFFTFLAKGLATGRFKGAGPGDFDDTGRGPGSGYGSTTPDP